MAADREPNIPDSPCRRVGRCLALLAGILMLTLVQPGRAEAQIKVRKADCYVEADGRIAINGVCEFLTDARSYGTGGFRLATYENGYLRYGVVVAVTSPGSGTATWNETPGGKPDEGPSEAVTSGGACWTGPRTRTCAWKIGEGRPGFAGGGVAPAPGIGAPRTADCLIEVRGAARIDGPCQFRVDAGQDGAGGFEVRSYARGGLDFIARLTRDPRDPQKATASWNERPGAPQATAPLGTLAPKGPCWEGAEARLCVWQAGQPRDASDRPGTDPGRAPPAETPPAETARPASPPVPRDNAGTETGETPPGMVLKLTFKGRCESLVVDGEDITASCAPTARNSSTTGSARAEFVFGTTDDREVSFLASAKGWVESGTLRQPIDEVMYEERGQSLLVKAKGVCEMPNPMGGPVVITCSAQTSNSTYTVRFRTDGGKPVLERSSPG
ncbi:hypothetical protein [Methylobacterium sp. Leaf93]|uniref:hypothetical protein n=1 Tax=Methylobacterium sp. Leaf93 TaxID=1736249 RepID=UPI0006F75B15|nr:hypothetical protein [Methylobacterium sp. Leaf93]KQP14608.1 hypothetical protein ASF26_17715 [Methylobacterium sp. Leaf93]